MDTKDRGGNHADKARGGGVSSPSGLLPRAYHRGLMVRVARVFHEHLWWRGGGAPPWKVIPVYICAASIWTYDGNNLEALAARRTCAASAAGSRSLHEATLGTGDVLSGCEQPVAGTNTMPCVPRWRELSRNKSRDEREMWPNRSSHTDTVFPWTDVAERERISYPDPFAPRFSNVATTKCAAVRIFK